MMQPRFRGLLLLVLLCIAFGPKAAAQGGVAYVRMATSLNTLVADTVSGLNLSIYEVSPLAKHGNVTVSIISTGGSGNPYVYAIKYLPDPGFTGVDTFTLENNYTGTYPYLTYQGYIVSTYPSLVTAGSDYAVTAAGATVTLDVLANDFSNQGPLSISGVPLSDNGTVSINAANQIEFTPAPGFTGIAHINYVVCNAQNQCHTADASIGVHPAGTPVSDSLQLATPKNTGISYPLLYDGMSVFSAPSHGIATLPDGKNFRYAPNQGYAGSDQFTLTGVFAGVTFYKTVTIQVLDVAGPNHMAIDDYVYTPKGQPITFNVRANDIGNLLVKSWSIPATLPGTVTGTNGSGNVTFTPNPDFTGVATFSYKIGNMFVPSLESATVRVAVGNMAPALATFNLSTPRETPLVINYKVPFTAFDFTIQNDPDHGTCTFFPGYTTQVINGQSVSGYNLLIYTPASGYSGSDEFEMQYCLSANGQCQDVKVTVDITEPVSQSGPYCVGDCVWPGDINADGVVNNKDLLPLGYFMGFDGPSRSNAALEWFGQGASNWNNPYAAGKVDLKHADTDGSGFISSDDTLAINLFYGQTHNLIPKQPVASKGLPFTMKLLTPNPGKGDLVRVEVSLGSNSNPVANVYGFTFDVNISHHLKTAGLHMDYYDNSWLNQNAPNLWMAEVPAENRLETAFTRTNGVSASGSGVVGEYDFIIIDIIIGGKPNPTALLHMSAPTIMWADGKTSTGDDQILEIPLRSDGQPLTPAASEDFLLYPVPAGDQLQVHLNGTDIIESLVLYDLTGKVVYQSGDLSVNHLNIDTKNLAGGCYIASARTTSGVVQKKFQVVR
jgi:hypothetical protein